MHNLVLLVCVLTRTRSWFFNSSFTALTSELEVVFLELNEVLNVRGEKENPRIESIVKGTTVQRAEDSSIESGG